MIDKNGSKKHGVLPRDAQLKLIAASKIGSPGSLLRRREIDKAYRYVETFYPEFLRQESR